jgi:2-phosphoglycerate kinase
MKTTVILIGGPSGVGKSTLAKTAGQSLGMPWLAADDLRLAVQALASARTPGICEQGLHFFERTPDVWTRPVDELRDAFIAIGRLLLPGIAIVARNHLAIGEPLIIEGDGILPEVLADPDLAAAARAGRLRTIFIVPTAPDIITRSMVDRRWSTDMTAADLATNVESKVAYGTWLAREAARYGASVIAAMPRDTLFDRFRDTLGFS